MNNQGSVAMSSVFSPLARAVLDSFSEGVVVFDPHGRVLYANSPAAITLNSVVGDTPRNAEQLVPELARLGARISPLRVGDLKVGDAVYLPDSGENPRHSRTESETLSFRRSRDTAGGWRKAREHWEFLAPRFGGV